MQSNRRAVVAHPAAHVLARALSHLRANLRTASPAQQTATRHAMLLIAAALQQLPRRI